MVSRTTLFYARAQRPTLRSRLLLLYNARTRNRVVVSVPSECTRRSSFTRCRFNVYRSYRFAATRYSVVRQFSRPRGRPVIQTLPYLT